MARQALRRPRTLRGAVDIPGDKSVSHRALMFNALASGSATIAGLSFGQDVVSTMGCMSSLGVEFESSEGQVTVHGSGGLLQESTDILDAGNSGTSMRLLSGLLAGQPIFSILTGDGSLRTRPMGRVITPLSQMGAAISGRNGNTLAPLAIRGGSLKGIEYSMPVASGQVKSAIILAGIYADGETLIHQPARSRDHTERMLNAMGASIEEDGLSIRVTPASLTAVDVSVPGDISSAAFWLAAGACHPDARVSVRGVGINPTRNGILDVLEEMGADISYVNPRTEGGEPVADLVVQSSQLKGIHIGGDTVPRMIDEMPVLAVAACFADGVTRITDAEELRHKESDRIATMVRELSRLGARIEELPDGMVIHGTGKLAGAPCDSYDDHRIAMSLAVAGMLADDETIIDGSESVDVSYPQFWDHLFSLGDIPVEAG